MEIHEIADFASRIGRNLMRQVFSACQVPFAFDWNSFDGKNADRLQAAKLRTLFPKGTLARRVRLRAWFDTEARRNRSKIFEISADAEHGFQDVPRHVCDAMRRFLEENKITRKEPADGDT